MMPLVVAAVAVALVVVVAWVGLRQRNLDRWIVSYLIDSRRRRDPSPGETIHLLLCIADHFEPKWGNADASVGLQRVDRWVQDYPRTFGRFHDSDGRSPRHTFFYPEEEYEADYLDKLGELCEQQFGEVEIHLHHDRDTPAGLENKIYSFKSRLVERHGLLGRDKRNGNVAYGFVHGNWALNNSRPDGRWCGVNDEISILAATGCYADFTLPSAPSPTQTRTVNRLYYARSNPARPRGHDRGVEVGSGPAPAGSLMLVQGPLALDWSRRKAGMVPRIENGCLQETQLPSMGRLDLWLKARINVRRRPDWIFVKLHTHGATESNQQVLLGEPMVRFHEALAERAQQPVFSLSLRDRSRDVQPSPRC